MKMTIVGRCMLGWPTKQHLEDALSRVARLLVEERLQENDRTKHLLADRWAFDTIEMLNIDQPKAVAYRNYHIATNLESGPCTCCVATVCWTHKTYDRHSLTLWAIWTAGSIVLTRALRIEGASPVGTIGIWRTFPPSVHTFYSIKYRTGDEFNSSSRGRSRFSRRLSSRSHPETNYTGRTNCEDEICIHEINFYGRNMMVLTVKISWSEHEKKGRHANWTATLLTTIENNSDVLNSIPFSWSARFGILRKIAIKIQYLSWRLWIKQWSLIFSEPLFDKSDKTLD